MNRKELRDLFIRAIGALETPANLTQEDLDALIEDLEVAAQSFDEDHETGTSFDEGD